MPRLLATLLVLVLAVLTVAAVTSAADEKSAAPSGPMSVLTPGLLKPTAPYADYNQPAQSSGLVAALHMRTPEKIIFAAVAVLLLICVVMFAFMLRQVYGAPAAKH